MRLLAACLFGLVMLPALAIAALVEHAFKRPAPRRAAVAPPAVAPRAQDIDSQPSPSRPLTADSARTVGVVEAGPRPAGGSRASFTRGALLPSAPDVLSFEERTYHQTIFGEWQKGGEA